ncbi:MAG: hypothetical protein IKV96_01695 [Firmicutes bacterium]|nr:hypothetical protein [Bacillota bacterium]
MKCPYCGKEMVNGKVKSAKEIFFASDEEKLVFFAEVEEDEEILLSSNNWTSPSCVAYHCIACRKVVMDYAAEVK